MKIYITNNTGSGKTALAVYLAKKYRYSKFTPITNPIYANLKINLPNVIYTPNMLLPYSTILKGNCLVIIDDVIFLENIKPIIEILAVLSRKTDIDIIITSQYDKKDIDKKVRMLCHNHIKVEIQGKKIPYSKMYYEKNTNLIQYIFKPDEQLPYNKKIVKDIFIKIKGLYNTNEIIPKLTDRLKKIEILKISHDIETLEFNVEMCYKDKRKQVKILKELMEIKGFDFYERNEAKV
jgi:hypothetical protein